MPVSVAAAVDQAAYRRTVADDIAPHAADFDAAEAIPAAVLRRLAELGWWGALVSTRDGGLGLGSAGFAALHEEVGRGCSSARSLLGAHSMVCWAVGRWGSAGQRARWLPELASGRTLGGFCLTEPEAGTDTAALACSAVRETGSWRLDGQKVWVTGGAVAGLFLVFARAAGGICAFLVPADTPGVRVTPRSGLLGLRASMPADVTLAGCLVPADALLGPAGFTLSPVLVGALDVGRLSVASGCVGILRACLDASLDHSARRRHGGAPLSDRQLVRRMIANMVTETSAARLLCAEAARLRDAGDPGSLAAGWQAKYFAAGAARRAATDAVQIHGAAGCATGSTVGRCYRDAKVMELIEGSTEVEQLVIADEAYRSRR
jgi:alkylation response protein AidB-like acyl-CoA dehydrogenase